MIEYKNVYKTYPNNVSAINGLSVKINQGDFVYVVGPSGAGKSTFIKMMYREEKPTSGHIQVNAYCLESIKNYEIPHFRRELGIVFQDFKLLPRLTVFENVAYALEVIEKSPDEIQKRVVHVLELVGLDKKQNSFPNELSGGEQQRVAIARAIANRPGILIADEPTGNLDPENAEIIMDILEKINKQGTTIVMATHNSHIVNEYRHRVLEISGGKIVRDQEGGLYEDEETNN
ncbi:cell division ATP-binding protein FtsE [Ligilactobacillus sp. Marseille-Q7487]|uniref:cell division ATP-binding protein FtsE n=1 Tax=Ligilactobacillus sp. Marseille-Q7487 TaxID=3022128 RepID=UPI0015B75535|nr:cell division ATP-binding protein FtsE [Ligilactobacillus sp. Marseille-Q7487]